MITIMYTVNSNDMNSLILYSHFPLIMVKFASDIGKAPHPTTLSNGKEDPRRRNNSNISTIPGLILCSDGSRA